MSTFRPDKPFNDLPLLPPAKEIETTRVLKKCIVAHRALAQLKQAGKLIPSQSVLINTIPLLEAQSSSAIENIVTTADALFRHAHDPSGAADAPTKETLRYRTALRAGYENIKQRPLNTRTAIEVCRTIRNVDIDIRSTPGTALANQATGEVIYTPPEGESKLRDLMQNWERFIHEQEQIDPLVRLAVMHYQFEAIHPFTDGNGRTGRVMNLLFLIEQDLLEIPVLYLSRYIIQHKDDYYRLLLEVTKQDAWEPWILFLLDAIEQTAAWTYARILLIRQLMQHTADYIKARKPKIYSSELTDAIFIQPYCRIGNLVDTGIVKRETASKYLKQLCEIGVLREIKAGREKLFVHPKFINVLTLDLTDITEYPRFTGGG